MKSLDNAVSFCDNHILVAVKPAGMSTQPDFEEAMKAYIKIKYDKPGNVFLHAVHRLDKPVSGLVLLARTSKALSRLNEQSRANEIERFYIAEVEGVLPIKQGKLDHYLVHGDHRAHIATKDAPDAKHARLTYNVLKFNAHSTLVEIQLDTGRYHQIRAQFSAAGHPIVGDAKYGAKKDLDAIHLHSAKLLLQHPVTKEALSFASSVPF
jgi:23S rRNA pseudouridine1911/1915/1917 synthase